MHTLADLKAAVAALTPEELRLVAVATAMGMKAIEAPTTAFVLAYSSIYDQVYESCTVEQQEIKAGDAVVFWEGKCGEQDATVALVRPMPFPPVIEQVAPWFRVLQVYAPHYPPCGHQRGGHVACMVPITYEAFLEVRMADSVIVKGSLAYRTALEFTNQFAVMLSTQEGGTS